MAEESKKQDKKTSNQSQTAYTKSLHRSSTNKVIAGVAGGLGEYFDFDPTIIRLIFVLITVFGGSGLLIYVILWLVMPPAEGNTPFSEDTIRSNAQDIKSTANKFAHDIRANKSSNEDSRFWFGIIVLLVGFVFLMSNIGVFDFFSFSRFWPLLLILFGLVVLFRK